VRHQVPTSSSRLKFGFAVRSAPATGVDTPLGPTYIAFAAGQDPSGAQARNQVLTCL